MKRREEKRLGGEGVEEKSLIEVRWKEKRRVVAVRMRKEEGRRKFF